MEKPARKVLIADDDRQISQALSYALTLRGIEPIAIFDGAEVVPAVRERHPDLIVLDIIMPGMNGYEVIRALKTDPDLAPIPVIMFTIKDQQDERLEGLELGAIDYIAKPFYLESLLNKIEYLLSKP